MPRLVAGRETVRDIPVVPLVRRISRDIRNRASEDFDHDAFLLPDAFARLPNRKVVLERKNDGGLEIERFRHRLRNRRRLGLGNHARKRECSERGYR